MDEYICTKRSSGMPVRTEGNFVRLRFLEYSIMVFPLFAHLSFRPVLISLHCLLKQPSSKCWHLISIVEY
jgi:hypothetical protein